MSGEGKAGEAAPLPLCGAGQSRCLRPRCPGPMSSARGCATEEVAEPPCLPPLRLHPRARAPAPQQVPLFARAWCISDPMLHAAEPFAPGHAEEIYPTTSNAK